MLAKAAGYAGTLGAAGAVFFLAYSGGLLAPEDGARILRLLLALLILAAVAAVARILAAAASMSGSAAGLLDVRLLSMMVHSGEGTSAGVRLLGLLFMVRALAPPGAASIPAMRPGVLPLLGAVLAATSFAWSGHVQALAPARLPLLILALHLLAVAFWWGALGPLLLVARGADGARIAAAVAHFGLMALRVVAVLVVAGACLLGFLLEQVSELWTSGYGRLVSTKLVGVAALLALAALNHWRLTPRLTRGEPGALQALTSSIRIETVAMGGVLLVTAAMTTLVGPASLDG